MSKVGYTAIAALLIATAVGSAWGFWQEYRAFYLRTGTMNDQIAALARPASFGALLSARTTRELVLDCARIGYAAPILKRDADLRARHSQACGRIAARILEWAPTNAGALAMSLGMADTVSPAALGLAQTSAPYEPWPLRIRLNAIAASAAPTSDLLTAARPDFEAAMLFRSGRQMLARLFLERDDLREAISAAAETSPAGPQSDFLAQIGANRRQVLLGG